MDGANGARNGTSMVGLADHGKHKKKQERCRSKSRAETCANRCGVVKNNCEKRVDCGSCSCGPPCPDCQICDDVTRTCQPDLATVGDPCGEPDQVCQSDGTCACDDDGACGGVCGCEAGSLCDNGVCQPCDVCAAGCAFSSVQAAIDAAKAGDIITVCAGVYTENIAIDQDVTLIGAGDGEDEAASTILDANGSGRTLAVNEDVTASLQGVRITGGNADLGGGVRNDGGLTLIACTISGNAASRGGGLYNSFEATGSLTLNDCQVTQNSASVDGGGFHNNSVFTVTLNGCTVSENRADDDGGGIFNNGGVFEITGSEISGNEAQADGGGVYNNSPVTTDPGEVTFDAASRITSNTAGGDGGGIFNNGTVTLGGATVTDNEPNNCAGTPVDGCAEGP